MSQQESSDFAAAAQAHYPGQAYNTPAMLELAASINANQGRLLDIGCGDGQLLKLLIERFPDIEVAGLTVSEQERLACGDRFDVRVGDMHCLPWKDVEFDVVISRHSLEHSFSPFTALFEVNRVLRLDGVFYVVVPAPVSEWVIKWKDHFSVLSRPMWEKLFDDAGFALVDYQEGTWLASFSMQSEAEMRFTLRKVRDIKLGRESSHRAEIVPSTSTPVATVPMLSTLVRRRIVVVLHNLVLFDAVKPVVERFNENVEFLVPLTGDERFDAMGERTCEVIIAAGFKAERTVLPSDTRCDIELSPYPYASLNITQAKWRVRFMYGLAKEAWNFSLENNACYDFVLAYGDYDARVLSAYSTPVRVGNPKIKSVRQPAARNERPVLLYLPTYGPTSSIEAVSGIHSHLKSRFRVIAKAHHGTTYLEPERTALLQSWVDELAHHDTDLGSLLELADVVLSDGSGAIFDAIAAEVPVAVFQETVFGGLGGSASLEERLVREGLILATSVAEDIPSMLERALQVGCQPIAGLRSELFAALGDEAAERAAAFLSELLSSDAAYETFAVARRTLRTRIAEGEVQRQARQAAERQLNEAYRSLADRLLADVHSLLAEQSERDGKIASFNQALVDVQHNYQNVLNSHSMKLVNTFRMVRRKAQTVRGLSRDFFNVFSSQGPKIALVKTKNWLMKRQAGNNYAINDLKMSDQEVYLINRSAQNEYVAKYIDNGLEDTHLSALLGVFLDGVLSQRKILVLPLSYPLELTQRPDHIVRFFSEHGYLCIMLQIDGNPPFLKEIAHNRYVTNVYAGVISLLAQRKNVVIYITYPLYGYLIDHMPRAQCLYDVLDDISVFSLNCDAMLEDHNKLLKRADVVMFSSKELMAKNSRMGKEEIFLVKNGVWVKDFQDFNRQRYLSIFGSDSFIVGYHGAISELLDWVLLEKITEIPGVKIVLIGPLVEFASYSAEILDIRDRVLGSSSVLHIPTVAYVDLKDYLGNFSLGLIPFVINEKTNPVLPLKLFEYMAMGLPVCATKTSTLLEFNDSIFVGSSEEVVSKINIMATSGQRLARIDYNTVLSEADWTVQIAPVADKLDFNLDNQSDAARVTPKKVDIVNVNFFDWDGVVLYKGGAERYVFDLACLMRDLGWAPRIIQNANHDFRKDFRGIQVVGVRTDSGGDIKLMSKKFLEVCRNSDLVIASPVDIACNLFGLRVIGINHGIYWDHKFKRLENNAISEYKNVFDSLRLAARVVAVDTNFINWTRTYDYSMAAKLTYVPNYFDAATFKARSKVFDERVRVLYPRRLYDARGVFITLKAFDYLLFKYPKVELHLVGQANEEDGKIVSQFMDGHSGRVIWEEYDMDDMHIVYQSSHIVLVPTLYAEGTSLSCIEAMATNNAVIATNIGGLPNLVVDGFNGFLINPTVGELVGAVEVLLNDRLLMKDMAARGLEMSKVFEKSNWLSRWKKVISEVIQ